MGLIFDEFQFYCLLIVCILVGIVFGDMKIGIIIGGMLEMIVLGWMNIGAVVAFDVVLVFIIFIILVIVGYQSIGVGIVLVIFLVAVGQVLIIIVCIIIVVFQYAVDKAVDNGNLIVIFWIYVFFLFL